MFKSVFIHTHINTPREITPLVKRAMQRIFSEGIHVRNQAVLLRGINDDSQTLIELARKLGRLNIQPYYVYACDMVKNTEHFRVPISEMQRLEREVRGATAGFNTPLFIVDAPGGGGKRDVHSYEYRNEEYGITGYRAPAVDPDRMYFYFDPLRSLDRKPVQLGATPALGSRFSPSCHGQERKQERLNDVQSRLPSPQLRT